MYPLFMLVAISKKEQQLRTKHISRCKRRDGPLKSKEVCFLCSKSPFLICSCILPVQGFHSIFGYSIWTNDHHVTFLYLLLLYTIHGTSFSHEEMEMDSELGQFNCNKGMLYFERLGAVVFKAGPINIIFELITCICCLQLRR